MPIKESKRSNRSFYDLWPPYRKPQSEAYKFILWERFLKGRPKKLTKQYLKFQFHGYPDLYESALKIKEKESARRKAKQKPLFQRILGCVLPGFFIADRNVAPKGKKKRKAVRKGRLPFPQEEFKGFPSAICQQDDLIRTPFPMFQTSPISQRVGKWSTEKVTMY
uniref:60S ribosomal protein L7a n=1 Tax=Steinernema glaseri TaxID=37863 RepID=A0A1I7Z1T4_9BILA